MTSYRCPHCGYKVYRTEVGYYEQDDYTVKDDDGLSTRNGWFEHKEYVYALERGKLTAYCAEKAECAFATRGKFIDVNSINK